MENMRKPEWIRRQVPKSDKYLDNLKLLKQNRLNTVCSSANCPNIEECFEKNRATFMILGKTCTRNCLYCNVEDGAPEDIDRSEPENIIKAIKTLELEYAVITSVTRDDLDDYGANHFVDCINLIKKECPRVKIEVLIPDFNAKPDILDKISHSKPDVINHNIETVKELFEQIRPEGNYENSIKVLIYIKEKYPNIITKSGIMVGLGETKEQLKASFKDLKSAGIDVLTIGQYMQPSKKHYSVQKYYTPRQFEELKEIAKEIGIKYVFSGPLVRSSYGAEEIFKKILSNSSKHIKIKIPEGKLLEINLLSKNNIITNIEISGDFFMHPEDGIEHLENSLKNKTISQDLINKTREFLTENNIQIIGFSEIDLIEGIIKLNNENIEL